MQDAKDLVPAIGWQRPVVNALGQGLYASWAGVFQNIHWATGVALYTFTGKRVDDNGPWKNGNIWHGTYPNGTDHPLNHCKEWTSGSSGDLSFNGDADVRGLLIQELHNCSWLHALVCVKTAD